MKKETYNLRNLKENVTLEYSDTQDAYNFAKIKHDATGAVRKNSGKLYFVHPEMVADVVAAYGGTIDEIEAALLHDILEDTNTTVEELESTFGSEVAQIVEEITNYGPEVERLGKEKYTNQELLEISNSALLVKLADMLCNSLDSPKTGQAERVFRNLKHLLEFRPDLDDRCRRLIKAFPLMDDYIETLDKPEFEDSFDELSIDPQYLTASTKRCTSKKFLKEDYSKLLEDLKDFCRFGYCLKEENAKEYLQFLVSAIRKILDNTDLKTISKSTSHKINTSRFKYQIQFQKTQADYFENKTLSDFETDFAKIFQELKLQKSVDGVPRVPKDWIGWIQGTFNDYVARFKKRDSSIDNDFEKTKITWKGKKQDTRKFLPSSANN